MTRRTQRSKGHVTDSGKPLQGLVAKTVWTLDELDADGRQAFFESLASDDLVTRQLAAFEAYATAHAPRDAEGRPIAALGYSGETTAPGDTAPPIGPASTAAEALWWIELVRAERERGHVGAAFEAFAALSGKFVELVVLVNERRLLIGGYREIGAGGDLGGNQKYFDADHDDWCAIARAYVSKRREETRTKIFRRDVARHVCREKKLDKSALKSVEVVLKENGIP